MAEWLTHYLSPKLVERRHPAKEGYGTFVTEPIARGELVVVWGGDVITEEQFTQLPPGIRTHTLQLEENIYLILSDGREIESGSLITHSCDPNIGFRSQVVLVACRDILPGEEICLDYAMSHANPHDVFTCACGSPNCRRRVTGNDWQLPELQARYAGYFSPYLQRRIDQIKDEQEWLSHNGRVRPAIL